MSDDPDWQALLKGYEAALEEFERAGKTLTAALVDRSSPAADLPDLLAAEARGRDAVILTRMRLMNAWRASQPEFDFLIQAGDATQHV